MSDAASFWKELSQSRERQLSKPSEYIGDGSGGSRKAPKAPYTRFLEQAKVLLIC